MKSTPGQFSSKDRDKVRNWWQLAGVERSRLQGGRSEGVEALDFRTGGGLRLQILAGRGMDIGLAEYRGYPLCWLSPAGVVHPSYFREEGAGFLDSACGGLMFTCGLTQAGAPCRDQGRQLGLHGRIANQPARRVGCSAGWRGDEFIIEATGCVEENEPFEYCLALNRTYRARLGDSRVEISDRVVNRGPAPAPHMILYHFNFGYPLVDEGASVLLASQEVTARDSASDERLAEWDRVTAPAAGFSEDVFYHKLKRTPQGRARAAVVNHQLELGAMVDFDARSLPRFAQWNCFNDRVYALGLEPANCLTEGRAAERKRGTLEFLQPGEERNYDIRLEVVEGADRLAELRRLIVEDADG
ncbi:MAG TPA: aldose 1-epimerase family protein [Acidobacteriota bacterium]|nr:aldose 1-epimerase family protein [Acidobacteriota bacterium]